MYKKTPVYLTDGKGGIYKIEKLIKAAVLKNLETGEQLTVEHPLAGFAIINMPKVEGAPASSPKADAGGGKPHKVYKTRKGKSSRFYGVTLDKRSGKWKTALWINKRNISAGSSFLSEEEAARAVDAKLAENGLPKRNFP